MFHPAGLGVNLLVFFLINGDHFARVIKNHKAGAGRALINCADVLGHTTFSFSQGFTFYSLFIFAALA
jgi:hypothetical protein